MIDQAQKELNEIKQRLNTLEVLMAKAQEPEDRFVPGRGDRYWAVTAYGHEVPDVWMGRDIDYYRLAIGNFGRTNADARRYKASLFVKTPTGPMPKDGDGLMMYFTNGSVGLWGPNLHVTAIRGWILGEVCVKGYEQELEAKWRRYGWSVIGEPEPEGWES